MSFPRYPEYKDSGVEWLGEVPGHWKLRPLKRIARLQTGMTPPTDEWDNYTEEEGFQWVRPEDIDESGAPTKSSKFLANKGWMQTRQIKAGASLICCIGTIGKVGITTDAVSTNQQITAAEPREDSRYLFYAICAGRIELELASTGNVLRILNTERLGNICCPNPPLPEQSQIAAFLDRETAKIDALVAEQRRLMELLKEKRQAVISHAVTRGLNPDALMKPSGIESLGDVPKHWEVCKMKWIAEMQSGHTPDKKIPEYWENGDIAWVSLNDTGYLKDHDYISETAYNVTQLGIANSSARMLPAGVVVFSRDATIGRCAITTKPMAVSQHFIAWVCGESMIPEFLLLRLRSMTGELDRLTTGATLKTIGMPDVRTLMTPVPPQEEQKTIIAYVAEQTGQLDTLTTEAQRAIDLLQERRTALITAAVTGQIDVRQISTAKASA